MKKQWPILAVLLALASGPTSASADFFHWGVDLSSNGLVHGPSSQGNNVFPIITGVVGLGFTTGVFVMYTVMRIANVEAAAYSDQNMAPLLADLSRQEGPYLDAYAAMMGCRSRDAIARFAQTVGPQVFGAESGPRNGRELTALCAITVQQDPRLWVACVGAL
jgi:hypothetical protein